MKSITGGSSYASSRKMVFSLIDTAEQTTLQQRTIQHLMAADGGKSFVES